MEAVSAGSPPVVLRGPPEGQAWHSPALSAKHLGRRRRGVKGTAPPRRYRATPLIAPREWLEAAVADMPVIVARRNGRVVGHLISASREACAGVPMAEAMLRAYPGAAPDAYVYGPICVAEEARGREPVVVGVPALGP